MVVYRCRRPLCVTGLALVALAGATASLAQTVYRASVATGGFEADWDSTHPAVSADGRYIAFTSGAFNLVPGGTPDVTDVYLRDRVTQQTTCVSVATAGTRGNAGSDSPSISADGRYIAFRSYASNLIPTDTNSVEDVFLRDTVLNTTILVSAAPGGAAANAWSDSPAISGDGAIVAYTSPASNIDIGVTPGIRNVFVWNRLSGITACISKATDGSPANGKSFFPSLSQDGRFVAYESYADNLVPGDTNNASDVFVWDSATSHTERASVATDGSQAATDADEAAISADGRWVAFRSYATNLAATPDNNEQADVFVRDRTAGATSLISIGLDGASALGESNSAVVSADGRYVAFFSKASNLVLTDTNTWGNVYIRNTVAHTTTRISSGDFWSAAPALTPSGVYAAFESYSDNLGTVDTNQMSDVYVIGPFAAAYSLYDVGRALRIAAGLTASSILDMARLDIQTVLGRIDVLDATRLTRKAMGLEP
jgi:Tol biopolymer transport system component